MPSLSRIEAFVSPEASTLVTPGACVNVSISGAGSSQVASRSMSPMVSHPRRSDPAYSILLTPGRLPSSSSSSSASGKAMPMDVRSAACSANSSESLILAIVLAPMRGSAASVPSSMPRASPARSTMSVSRQSRPTVLGPRPEMSSSPMSPGGISLRRVSNSSIVPASHHWRIFSALLLPMPSSASSPPGVAAMA